MEKDAMKFLSKVPPFSKLKQAELERVAEDIRMQRFNKGEKLFEQGKTRVDAIYVIARGSLELLYKANGDNELRRRLKRGEVYGANSILMNSGIADHTVVAAEDVVVYALPEKAFLEICTRETKFYEYFAEQFRRRITDKSFEAIIVAAQAIQFLSQLEPFTFLPKSELEKIASSISLIYYPKDTVLFVQGKSRVEYLYIVHHGALECYYEEGERKTLREVLGEGDLYGGISILLNNGISIRTLKSIEDSRLFVLPKKLFMELCEKYQVFSEYFTDLFGKKMLNRSYAQIIASGFKAREDALQVFNMPVEGLYNKELLYCSEDLSIQEAARLMSERNCSSIVVRAKSGEFVGLVTDKDLRTKVVACGCDFLSPVSKIMSSPIHTIPSHALVFEALVEMMRKKVKHLIVVDDHQRVLGILAHYDLLRAQGQAPVFVMQEIAQASTVAQVVSARAQVPNLIYNLINAGAKPQHVARFLSTIADAVLEKMATLALERLGPPPVRFSFIVMGSEGRREQTLKTDQDNALIYEDPPKSGLKEAKAYFLKLGELICGWLNEAGYYFCKGDVMAKNPRWCQPLSVWKGYFTNWIHHPEPEALLRAGIFFDLRHGFGESELVVELKDHLFGSLEGWPGFFRHMAENALFYAPPIGFFRNFVVLSKGEHRDSLDIKAAIQPIVDFARVYALHNKIPKTNTWERLEEIAAQKVITREEYNEIETAYSYLMQVRFVHQVKKIVEQDKEPDNYITPKHLSRIEQTMLKEIFVRVEKFQAKLNFDFTGRA